MRGSGGFLLCWHRLRIRCTVFFFAAALIAQTSGLSPDVLFLSKAQRRIREGILAVPSYTCLETIARERRAPGAKAIGSKGFERLDLVRLEVAKEGPRELFAWPGARKFEDRPISDFVAGGLMGNGAFALFADDLFVHRAATMKVRGPEQLDGRTLVRVDYSVASLRGMLTLTTATGSADVTYSGSWWVDPVDLGLVRLDIIADDIPPHLQLSRARISIEYGDVSAAILPVNATIEFTKPSGEVSLDEIEFTHCRKFSGAAELILDAPDVAQAVAPEAAGTLLLPGGLSIPLRLETTIDARTAGVGDEVIATVDRDVKDKQRVWAPKGSLARGRIRRLLRRDGFPSYELIGIEFSELEANGQQFEFIGQLETAEGDRNVLTTFLGKELTQTNRRGGVVETQVSQFYEREIPGVGYLYVTAEPYRVGPGLRLVWKTEAVRQGAEKP